jgi:hypothetical protein
VVGPGYVWLGSGVILLLGLPAVAAGAGPWAIAGTAGAVAAIPAARHRVAAVPALGVAAVCYLVSASLDGPPPAAVTGALLLGGVTGEMMLGHWYLVDPRLPRWALRRLDLAGAAGALLDLGALAVLGAIPWSEADLIAGTGFVLLSLTTVVLMGMVWFSLGEEGYAGVMAATGLSYLATLTAIGAAVVGRLVI